MAAKLLAISAAIIFLAVAPTAAQSLDAQDDGYCQQIGAQHGSVNYRQCRLLLGQTRSNDPYTAAGGHAGLALLQQQIFDRLRQQEERPDFSGYGAPAPSQQMQRPSSGCVVFGDGLGGGIADCN